MPGAFRSLNAKRRAGRRQALKQSLTTNEKQDRKVKPMKKEQLIDEMARCIADWSNGGDTTAKIDGIKFLDSEDFLCGWCGDFSLAEVLEGRTPADVAREYVDAVWDEVDMRYNKFTANFEAGSGHAGLAQPLKGANFDLLAEQIRELAASHGEPCRVIITEWGDYSKFSQVSRLEGGRWTEWEPRQ